MEATNRNSKSGMALHEVIRVVVIVIRIVAIRQAPHPHQLGSSMDAVDQI